MSLHDDMVPTAEELAVLRFRPYRVRPSGAGYRQEFVNWDDLDDREKTEAVARLRAEKMEAKLQAKLLAPADPWARRSKGMRCDTCMWWLHKEPADPKATPLGRCRRHAPTMSGFPAIYADDWCGDHKLKESIR